MSTPGTQSTPDTQSPPEIPPEIRATAVNESRDFPTPPAIRASGASRVFGRGKRAVTALDDVDLTVAAGEFVSLIGPSGCG